MKKLTIEEKAKAYDEAIERAKNSLKDGAITYTAKSYIEEIFPELAESEHEKVRKELIEFVKSRLAGFPQCDKYLTWFEKQGEIDKESYEIAEKEKEDFVSGQFIECRKSFNVFKEDNSYWFEYIGNDTYIGRSDNILNKKFHITPRQLYRLFTQQHCPKEDNNVNEKANAPTNYGKYVDECLNKASKHFFSKGEDTYSVADLFHAGVRCGQSLVEKQDEQKQDPCEHCKDNCFNCHNFPCIEKRTFEKGKSVFDVTNEEDAEKKEPKKIEQKPAWSEEDECYMSKCIGAIATKDGWSFEEKRKTKHWLESFKERCTWKPSDKQMEALKEACDEHWDIDGLDPLYTLYQELKKLKEE